MLPPPLPEPRITIRAEDLRAHPERFDRRLVEVVGIWRSGHFETSDFEGTYLEEPDHFSFRDKKRSFGALEVRVMGVVHCDLEGRAGNGYGHMDAAKALLVATSVVVLAQIVDGEQRSVEPTADEHALWLAEYVVRARKETPGPRTFPQASLRCLREQRQLTDALEPALWELLGVIGRMDTSSAEGEDLAMVAEVLPVIARLTTPTERMARRALGELQRSMLDRYQAQPGGGDPDKYDRDADLERAQDALALAAVEALARLAAVAPREAAEALANTRTHRSPRVRSVAAEVLRLVQDDYLPRG